MIGDEIFTIRTDMYSPWRIYTPFRFYMEMSRIPFSYLGWVGLMVVLIEKSEQGNCYIVYSLN